MTRTPRPPSFSNSPPCFVAPAFAALPPNIVLILVDDMGYGDPGCFNPHSKIATPNIDRLAREGMRFTDAHAPGAVCHPSRYGLMTGSYGRPARFDPNAHFIFLAPCVKTPLKRCPRPQIGADLSGTGSAVFQLLHPSKS